MVNRYPAIGILLITVWTLASCSGKGGQQRLSFSEQEREVPEFNADSAYHFIEQQVLFGPRNPGSEAHALAKDYIIGKLKDYAGDRSVYAQNFTVEGYDKDTMSLTNLIAAFNTGSRDRILLCAHWDSRPRADKDTVKRNEPIPGADDGGSGVGVLLEMARLFHENPPPIGVDVVFFDGEDYGREGELEHYFLGSRYWAENPPVPGYSPRFGILLDMVGGLNARFPKEQYSLRYAPALVDEIWQIAADKELEEIFIDQRGQGISDDHVIINQKLNIPTIDIIRHEPRLKEGGDEVDFAPYWHTHQDNMNIISKKTLNAVGIVIAELVYNRVGTVER